MDYNNINLSDSYEIEQNILDPYSIDTLLLEIHSNFKKEDITKQKVLDHINKAIQYKVDEAKSIFSANIDNIVKHALKDKK